MADQFTFLSVVRFGLSRGISAGQGLRARLNPVLHLSADGAEPQKLDLPPVEVYGPGDVIGFAPESIIRTEPRAGAGDFEPTLLASVDFADEDFPWRYTPAAATDGRLQPWIALLVLARGEFEIRNRSLVVQDPGLVPPVEQLWAWAHAHVNRPVADAQAFSDTLAQDPANAYARLLAPRRLQANTRYFAFVVPSFEAGRLAGLGRPFPAGLNAMDPAWRAGSPVEPLPVYYSFEFGTCEKGDFEDLARLLKPWRVEKESDIGRRLVDVRPWPGDNSFADTTRSTPALWLEGALRHPDRGAENPRDPNPAAPVGRWDPEDKAAFEAALTPLLQAGLGRNVAAGGTSPEPAGASAPPGAFDDADDAAIDDERLPVVAPPVYGAVHAGAKTLDAAPPWLRQLNLDPGFRIPAGFGTRAVQRHQEAYMARAWKQHGQLFEVNRLLRFGQFYRAATGGIYRRMAVAQPQASAHLLALARPAHASIRVESRTVLGSLKAGTLKPGFTSGALQRRLRPGGPMAKRLVQAAGGVEGTIQARRIGMGMIERIAEKDPRPAQFLQPSGRIALVSERPLVSANVTAEFLASQPSVLQEFTPHVRPDVLDRIRTTVPIDLSPILPDAGGLDANQPPVDLGLQQETVPIRQIHRHLERLEQTGGTALSPQEVRDAMFRRVAQGITRGGADTAIAADGTAAAGTAASAVQGADQQPVERPRSGTVADAIAVMKEFAVAPEVRGLFSGPKFSSQGFASARLDQAVIAEGADLLRLVGGAAAPNPLEAWQHVQKSLVGMQRRIDLDVAIAPPPAPATDLSKLSGVIAAAIKPGTAITQRVRRAVEVAAEFWGPAQESDLDPIMPAPTFEDAMCDVLRAFDEELILPNIAAIPNNVVTLVETNQPFIEAFMAGVNHEMARELLWREYPTDRRGSYFRRFWRTDGLPGLDAAARDTIAPIHGWQTSLGLHPAVPRASESLVLTIRGDLLRRYPNTVVYATKGLWIADRPEIHAGADAEAIRGMFGSDAFSRFRRVPDPVEWAAHHAARDEVAEGTVKYPIFKAEAADCFFFGFDLDEAQARGNPDAKDAGWYLVLAERVGEPRFGADSADGAPPAISSWNELTWGHFKRSQAAIAAGGPSIINLNDVDVALTDGTPFAKTSAHVAKAMLQKPVRVYFHSTQLLPR